MKGFRFFENVSAYKEFMRRLIATPGSEFTGHPFYSGLVDWVIDVNTPLCFIPHALEEHANFGEYFKLIGLRYYKNEYISALHYIHDMVHSVLHQPVYPREFSYHEFEAEALGNEVYASDETEVMTYLRLPQIRDLTFKFPILYDLLKHAGYTGWNVSDLANLRRVLQASDAAWWSLLPTRGAEDVKRYMTRTAANHVWTGLWYENTPRTLYVPVWNGTGLTHWNYERTLTGYRSKLTQPAYEQHMIQNVKFWYELVLGDPPPVIAQFSQVKYLLAELEGKIVLGEASKIFHQTLASKATAY